MPREVKRRIDRRLVSGEPFADYSLITCHMSSTGARASIPESEEKLWHLQETNEIPVEAKDRQRNAYASTFQ